MKKFFIIVITLVILSMMCYIVMYFTRPVNSTELEQCTYEALISCDNAYIVRNESVYYATSAGTVYNNAREGERVSKDEVISNIFGVGADNSYLQKLHAIDNKINRLERQSFNGSYSMDRYSAENDISARLNSVISLSQSNSVEDIHDIKEDINRYRSGESVSVDRKIDELLLERERIENILKKQKSDILSMESGIFSSYVDGLEAVLSPERVSEYTAQYIKSLSVQKLSRAEGESVIVGDPVCKVMNNHEWYVLGTVNEEHRNMCEVDEKVAVRFSGITSAEVNGTVTYVSDADENGEYIFLIRIPSYIECAFSYRIVKAEIIFEKYEGYKIPIYAVHTREGMNEYYVNAMKGSESYECDCDILFTDSEGEYSIIQSTESAKNKLSSMERLIVGER